MYVRLRDVCVLLIHTNRNAKKEIIVRRATLYALSRISFVVTSNPIAGLVVSFVRRVKIVYSGRSVTRSLDDGA